MNEHRCPVPGCDQAVSGGVFCTSHYFALPRKDTAFLDKWRFKLLRCQDDASREYMQEQLHGYVAAAVRKIVSGAPPSQAALARARRLSPNQTAGA